MLTQTVSNEVVISPSRILQTGLAFWSSKLLLSAVNLRLFTLLSDSGKSAEEIREALGLQSRGLYDFLDALVAIKMLYREGSGSKARYFNTLEADVFLDRNKASYVGGILEMANNRLYSFWSNLEEGLKTGLPQNEAKNGDKPLFETLYADENRLEEFLSAMAGVQKGNFISFARQFDFTGFHTHLDVGGAAADLSIQLAIHQPALQSTSFDLPQVAPIAQRNIDRNRVADRVSVMSGDFFNDALPKADIITMGNILHDWNTEEKIMLIRKAYDALPEGGALVVIENIIDDERKENAFGLMMSLNMLIETYGGFDYTLSDFTKWGKLAGFRTIRCMPLTGPASAIIAYK